MPQTPTDPTKAQVWVMGEAPNQQLEFYFPRGAKGEPGGWTAATDLATTNLDDIKTPGLYRQGTAANATALLNYPAVASGSLEVLQGQSSVEYFQRYTPFSGSPAVARVLYIRRFTAGTWSAWTVYMSSRVDQTAGRAIYQWDHVNNREQLVYGDTGQRSILNDQAWIDALFPTNVAPNGGGIVRVRRVGYEVELVVALDKNATGSISAAAGFPVGFRPSQPVTSLGSNSGFVTVRAYHGGGATPINWNSTAVAVAASVTLRYTTVDAWPTTLPGVAVGSIPNL